MDEKYTLPYLDKDWKRATVYMAFLEPKTQQDAVRLIYGIEKKEGNRSPVINHPVQWITDTREELMDNCLLIRMDNKLRGSIIKANTAPIIQSLIEAHAEMSNKPDVLKGVGLILESAWFRNFFSYNYIRKKITYLDGTVYEPYRDILQPIHSERNKEKLVVTNFQNRLFQLLYEIGYYSHNIRYLMNKVKNNRMRLDYDSILSDLIRYGNFDFFMQGYQEEIPPYFIEAFDNIFGEQPFISLNKIYCSELFNKLLTQRGGIFIPEEVSILLRSAPCHTSVRTIDMGFARKMFRDIYKQYLDNKTMR